tara:strand:- start:122 stop:820 length:699 start_codon:yes stop_codon:yes gene_type:complete
VKSGAQGAQHLSFELGNNLTHIYKTIFKERSQIIDERNRYQQEAQVLSLDFVEKQELENRIRELERLLEYTQTVEIDYATAAILSRSQDNDRILIDKGARDGMELGSAVVVEDGHLLAVITEVREQTSIAEYTMSKNVVVSGSVSGRGRTSGLIKGDEGFFLTMELIPKTDSIGPGELIVTSGLDYGVRAGLILGIVEEVIDEESSAFKSAKIRPLIDHLSYSNVLIASTPE